MVWLRCHAINSVVNQHVPAPLLRGWYGCVVTRFILWSISMFGTSPSRMVCPRRHAINPVVKWKCSGALPSRMVRPRCHAIDPVVKQKCSGALPSRMVWLRCQAIILWSIRMFRAFPSRMVWYALQPIKWDGRSRILTSSHFRECGDNRVRHVVLLMDGEVKVRPRRQGLMSPTPAETCLLQPSFKKNLYNHTDNRDSRPL